MEERIPPRVSACRRRPHALLSRGLVATILLLLPPFLAFAGETVLTGQVVCTVCWTEADRTKVPYGTAADLACWRDTCKKRGVPAALAVTETGGTRLVGSPGTELEFAL